MADLSSNSFIPKRGPTKRRRKSASKQVYVFTIISYVLLFATLLAAWGVFFYTSYVDRQLQQEIATLNREISSFNEIDMQRVLDFEQRLQQASGRVYNSISIVSVFEALQDATIDTVQVANLNISRHGDEKVTMEAAINTDSFDSTMFQRGVYERSKKINSNVIGDLQALVSDTAGNADSETGSQSPVTFTAELELPLSSVPFEVEVEESVVIPESIEAVEATTTEVVNEEVI